MEERRQNSIDNMMLAIGRLEEIGKATSASVTTLSERVGVQNGRVSRLERWQAFIQGALAIVTVLMVPIFIMVVSNWFKLHLGV